MKRIIAAVLAFLLICSTFFVLASVNVTAESLYIRKVVSVVYDDSGSMKGDKWAYANYAMQAFCGMLNSEDKLFITFMSYVGNDSSYEPNEMDLSSGGIQASVDKIRNHTNTDSTPFAAVEMAFNKLKSVDDPNVNTQYWLVVITDGMFDETRNLPKERQIEILNNNFDSFVKTQMPNGTSPRITFLTIGNEVASPDEDTNKGIFRFSADNANGITDAMSKMADKISGRTRLDSNSVSQIDEKTIQVSSSIPLLNIAVFSQKTDAKPVKAVHDNEDNISVSRTARLSYSGYKELFGSAVILGDSKAAIGSGNYVITFDKPINIKDVVILFEPALELKMFFKLNGKDVTDISQIKSSHEGDKLSASCKVYEMGTDIEIDQSLLPSGTKYMISVTEDGKQIHQSTDRDMVIPEFVLKHIQTDIQAEASIAGFNPIVYSLSFFPEADPSYRKYSITAEYVGDAMSVKYDSISSNSELAICFTVFSDGVAMTNPQEVKALNPVISTSVSGNDGTVTVAEDGKIIFTPNSAQTPSSNVGSYDVDVTCTLDDGTNASLTYKVVLAEFQVVPVTPAGTIKKTELFGNQIGVSFYIIKDGTKISKEDVGDQFDAVLNEIYSDLKIKTEIDEDGTITVIPYSEEEHRLTFFNWWGNWWYYFSLRNDDIVVTFNHALGSAESVIDVTGAGKKYVILNVVLPLLIEILLLAAIIAYIVRYYTKARFSSNAKVYVGSIYRDFTHNNAHVIELTEIGLKQFNVFKNLWNPFKELTVSVNGVSITAAKGSRIICNEEFPWYSDNIRPLNAANAIDSPSDIVTYCQENDGLLIQEIKSTTVMDEQNKVILPDGEVFYFFRAYTDDVENGSHRLQVIESATAFCYSLI